MDLLESLFAQIPDYNPGEKKTPDYKWAKWHNKKRIKKENSKKLAQQKYSYIY